MPSAKVVPCIMKGECILNLSNSLDVTNNTLGDSYSGLPRVNVP